MLELQEITYLAIITIETPGLQNPIRVSVKILPPDYVELLTDTAGDQQLVLKPLRECTLADLRNFAQKLESDIAEDIEQIRLSEFAIDDDSELKIQILNDKMAALPSRKELWQKGVLVSSLSLEDVAQVIDDEPLENDDTKELVDIQLTGEDEADENASGDEAFTFLPEARSGSLLAKASVLARALLDDDETVEAAVVNSDDETETEPESTELADLEEITIIDESPPEEDDADGELADDGDEPLADDDLPRILVDETESVHETRKAVGNFDSVHIADKEKLHDRMGGQVLSLDDPTPSAVDILVAESAFRDAKNHALTSLNREVAGVLIGPHPQKQPNGRYVVQVTDAIVAEHTRMHGASVTYTPESWRYVNDKLMEMYPNEECVIVGWYHTHPGFGIFLSNMDLFIHHNFFTQKWHIALVLDPIAKKSGFFTWNRPQSEVMANHFAWPYWAHSSW